MRVTKSSLQLAETPSAAVMEIKRPKSWSSCLRITLGASCARLRQLPKLGPRRISTCPKSTLWISANVFTISCNAIKSLVSSYTATPSATRSLDKSRLTRSSSFQHRRDSNTCSNTLLSKCIQMLCLMHSGNNIKIVKQLHRRSWSIRRRLEFSQ